MNNVFTDLKIWNVKSWKDSTKRKKITDRKTGLDKMLHKYLVCNDCSEWPINSYGKKLDIKIDIWSLADVHMISVFFMIPN